MSNMPQILYLPDNRLVNVEAPETILETSLCAGIPHTHVCGGSARCSTCRVWVLEGLEQCAPRNDAEWALAKRLQFDPRIRLACQTQVMGDGQVTVRRLAIDAEDLELINRQIHGKITPTSIGQEKQIAILFADIRGFTTFSELLPPYDVIYVLNRYFHRMGKAIARHGGMINNYMGDGLMALFGWDDPTRAAERAVRAALDMQAEMEQFNAYLESMYHHRLQIGIGIHYGQAVIGVVGASADNNQITAIGDAVNLASRIESANKRVGTQLLISEQVYAEVRDRVTINQQCSLEIPGKSGIYVLYEVTDIAPLTAGDALWSPPQAVKRSRFGRLGQAFGKVLGKDLGKALGKALWRSLMQLWDGLGRSLRRLLGKR
ncbi:MAG TPA: adenylate/guanylate cyclase domain-containing protein [Chroococcidiopsis sp.]